MSFQQDTQEPLVSVVTPTLNQGKYIRQTIDSVLGQSYPKIEYWVIDGGSSDNTLEILRSYGERLNFISERDSGQANAINKGLRRCKGEILCYLNSDDWLLPGAIAHVVDAFKRSGAQWVTGDYRIVDGDGKPVQGYVGAYKRLWWCFSSRAALACTNFINQPSTFWRRELFEQIGEFDETLCYTMDYDYWLRAYLVARPQFIRRELSAFRVHAASKGGSEYGRQFDEELLVLQKQHIGAFAKAFHRFHNTLIKSAYQIIKKPDRVV